MCITAFGRWITVWPQRCNVLCLQSVSFLLLYLLKFFSSKCAFFSMANCQTNWGFPEEWHSTWKWEFGALAHYVALTRLQSSSLGVSLGPLRLLNNDIYSLSRELISCKLSNQHWRAWRALKESWVQSDWRLLKKKIFGLNFSFFIPTGPQLKVARKMNSKHIYSIYNWFFFNKKNQCLMSHFAAHSLSDRLSSYKVRVRGNDKNKTRQDWQTDKQDHDR